MSTRPPLRHRAPSRPPRSTPSESPGRRAAVRARRRSARPGEDPGHLRVRRRSRRPSPGPLLLAERAATLFPAAPAYASGAADAVRQAVPDPHVLRREVAVAAARDAVRRSRIRRQHTPGKGRSRAGPGGLSEPVGPEPVGPEPAGPEPVGPEPVGPEPVGPEPAGPEPVGPEPAGPAAEGGRRQKAQPTHRLWQRMPLWVRLRCGMELRTVLALAVVLCAALVLAAHHFWSGRPQPVRAPEPRPPAHWGSSGAPASGTSGSHPDGAGGGRKLVVDVAGKVREPGVYRLPAGSRVEDALEKAGGLRPGTDIQTLNRARLLVDGEQITAGGPPGPASATGAGAGAAAPSNSPVSLNTATAEQLETLPGVGPVLAQHLIEFREQNGGFTSVSQLREVNGIGDRRFADLKSQVRP